MENLPLALQVETYVKSDGHFEDDFYSEQQTQVCPSDNVKSTDKNHINIDKNYRLFPDDDIDKANVSNTNAQKYNFDRK